MGGPGIPQPPPGMSFYAAKRVIGDSPWTPELLEQVLAAARLVLSEWGGGNIIGYRQRNERVEGK